MGAGVRSAARAKHCPIDSKARADAVASWYDDPEELFQCLIRWDVVASDTVPSKPERLAWLVPYGSFLL